MRILSLSLLLLTLLAPSHKAHAGDTLRWTHEFLPVTKDATLHMDQLWFYGTHPGFSFALRTNKDDGIDTLTLMPGTPPLAFSNGDLLVATWLTAGAVLSTNYHLEPISITAEWNTLFALPGLTVFNIFQGRIGLDDRSHKVNGKPLGDAPDHWIETLMVEVTPVEELSVGLMWRFTIKVPAQGDTKPWHTLGPTITWRFYQPLFFNAWPYLANVSDEWAPGIAFSVGFKLPN